MTIEELESRFTRIDRTDQTSFAEIEQALEAYQYENCEVYRRFGQKYLPIAAFKHAEVASFPVSEAECIFLSSATGSSLQSRHFVRRLAVYESSVCAGFEAVFGSGPFTIWAHLPGYTPDSSLVCMMRILIENYGDDRSQFFLGHELPYISFEGPPILVFGAAFGLLNLIEIATWRLPPGARIIETGGMKTHRREITRSELHQRLALGFGIDECMVWSEYGMCELLSQAYAQGGSIYQPPPWMRIQIVDPYKPEQVLPSGTPGLLAITDLANIHTVSSILTEDLGVGHTDGIEVLGRISGSELRGCNFLMEGG